MAEKKKRGRPRKVAVKDPDFMEIDDLIGGATPRVAGPAPFELSADDPKVQAEDFSSDLGDIFRGVSTTWLGAVFNMDSKSISRKLGKAGVTPVGKSRGANLYTLKDAAQYLIKPKVDLQEYIKGLRPNDLPPMLNDAYWRAMIQRQKWEENARDLWRTDDVLSTFGELAMAIKGQVSLWVEELDRVHGLNDEMRKQITQMSDNLLQQIHEIMIEAPRERSTLSSLHEEGVMPDGGPQLVEGEE